MTRKRIGFDFDKIFVSYPLFIPDFFIDYLYKKKHSKLKYRYPGFVEQHIRILSHSYILRPPIKSNILALKKIYLLNKTDNFLISSRFSFLKDKTSSWLKKTKIDKYFRGIYFNFIDRQPHLFKDSIIKKEKIEDFIDDDLDLLLYLSSKNPKVNFYWINKNNTSKLENNIFGIRDVNEYIEKYL